MSVQYSQKLGGLSWNWLSYGLVCLWEREPTKLAVLQLQPGTRELKDLKLVPVGRWEMSAYETWHLFC